jgi:hypothetical protein
MNEDIMQGKKGVNRDRSRREFLKVGAAGVGITGLGGTLVAEQTLANSSETNPIQKENNESGDQHWRSTRTIGKQAPQHVIEGYMSETSVVPGGTVELHVSTDPPQRYRTTIHRLGWYGGKGGRRIATLPEKQGNSYPIPEPNPNTGKIECDWPVTNTFEVPKQATSGVYLAEFTLTTGRHRGEVSWYPFIVRAGDGQASRSTVLVQIPTSTWQAYNDWGGKSLYGFNSTGGPADKVSYDRPLRKPLLSHANGGPMAVYYWEYMIIRYLERHGYDVSYVTNDDIYSDPSRLVGHEVVISTGHNEYWSNTERDGYEAARATGEDLLFICSNTCYWQVRYEDDTRTMVGYKANIKDDPLYGTQLETDRFRDLPDPRPECELMGVMYEPPIVSNSSKNYPHYPVVDTALDHPWMEDTGFEPGAVPNDIVGYELDHIWPDCDVPGELTKFFDYAPQGYFLDSGQGAQAVSYTAPAGATVFSTGSMNFAWALSDFPPPVGPKNAQDPRVQRFVQNILADMTRE